MTEQQAESKLGFLDSLIGLLRVKPGEAPPAKPAEERGFEALRASFEAALRDLDDKADEVRRQRGATSPAAAVRASTAEEERAAERARRLAEIRETIREEIVGMHRKLGTGVTADLEALSTYLEEVAAEAEGGKKSHELLPRARFTIAERVQREAGELAVARLMALLQRQSLAWPDPTRYRPGAKPEEIERSRRRRLAEVREALLGQSLRRTAERMLGIVKVWGSDYPDRGSPLWEETVLEGVAAGIRGDLVKECIEVLRRDQDRVASRAEAFIGKELLGLQQVLKTGVTSIEQANQAAASALRVLDEVVPDLAWEHVRSQVPRTRGEWGE